MSTIGNKPPLALYAAAALIVLFALHGPIAQLEHYHAFADQRVLFGIAHAGDVLSNAAFLGAAVYGAYRLAASALAGPARLAAGKLAVHHLMKVVRDRNVGGLH